MQDHQRGRWRKKGYSTRLRVCPRLKNHATVPLVSRHSVVGGGNADNAITAAFFQSMKITGLKRKECRWFWIEDPLAGSGKRVRICATRTNC